MRTVGHTRRGAVESRTKGVDAMSDRIDIAMLHRPGSRGKSERHSVDFLVNGRSLFVATRAAQHDLCGCFSPDYAKSANELAHHENERLAKLFLFESPLQIASDRVALFVCPERSDPACGAITIQLRRRGQAMLWANFAYENGYDDERSDSESYAAIWPFEFALGTYLENIQRATSLELKGVS
jgi:hypothetical protein